MLAASWIMRSCESLGSNTSWVKVLGGGTAIQLAIVKSSPLRTLRVITPGFPASDMRHSHAILSQFLDAAA
jgi:hypothetical protein